MQLRLPILLRLSATFAQYVLKEVKESFLKRDEILKHTPLREVRINIHLIIYVQKKICKLFLHLALLMKLLGFHMKRVIFLLKLYKVGLHRAFEVADLSTEFILINLDLLFVATLELVVLLIFIFEHLGHVLHLSSMGFAYHLYLGLMLLLDLEELIDVLKVVVQKA